MELTGDRGFFSGEKLVEHKGLQVEAKKTYEGGPKLQTPSFDLVAREKYFSHLQNYENALSQQRIQNIGALSQAEWIEATNEVIVTKQRGRSISHLGYVKNQKRILHPEEALFLVDSGQLEITNNGIPFSLQEAYSKIMNSTCSLQQYEVYSHLMRLGYIVLRYKKKSPITDYERRINLTQSSRKRKVEMTTFNDSKNCSKFKTESIDLNEEHCDASEGTFNSSAQTFSKLYPQVSMKDIEIPNFYRVNKCTIKPPEPEYLPPGVYFKHSSYEIDIRKFDDNPRRRYRRHQNRRGRRNSHKKIFTSSESPESVTTSSQQQPVSEHSGGSSRDWFEKDFSLITTPYNKVNYKWSHRLILNFRHYKASSWREYKIKVLLGHKTKQYVGIQALYEGNVKPLCHKADDKYHVRNSFFTSFDKGSSLSCKSNNTSDVIYDIHLPNSNYKRTVDCLPDLRVIIYSVYNSYPTLTELFNQSSMFEDEVPLYAALVDNGKVHFYSQHHIRLPHLP